MDCPEPIKLSTPDLPLKLKKSKKFNSRDEKGKAHEIEMGIAENSILFKAEINNGIISKKYSSIYSFDKLKQNNIFIFQENIQEIYEQLEIYINAEEVHFKLNENNITISIFTKIKKFPEINFELKPEFIDNNKIINILMEKFKNLEDENRNLKIKIENLEINYNKSINEQKSENQVLKSEIEDLKNDLNSIKEYINKKKEKERQKEMNKFPDSLIVKQEESKMICEWINPNKNIDSKLLYRVSRDGDGPEIFHKYCDNKGPTIMFAKINNGYRFGGFAGISWTSEENQWVKDKDAFLFSLNNKLKFNNNHNTDTTVYHGKDYGPDFGNTINELIICYCVQKCLTGKTNFSNDSGSGFSFTNKTLLGVNVKGKYNLDVEDYEVYSIQI